MVQAIPPTSPETHHTGFFQKKSVQTVLPFMTSLAFHAGIVVLALTTYQVVTHVTRPVSEVPPPTDFTPMDIPTDPTSKVSPDLFKGIGKDPTRDPAQDFEVENVDLKSMKFSPGDAKSLNLNPGGSEGADQESLIGPGPGKFGNNKGKGTGFGPGTGPGTGEAQEGLPGKFGITGGGSDKLPRPRPGARKIVYVCDATGSMTPVFSGLRTELDKEITSLQPLQFFNVIFFSDDKVISLSPSLVMANPAGKTKATAFFSDVSPRGLTNPLPAIRAAFAQDPDVIYVLTDGFDQISDLSSVVKEFDSLNKDRKVQVHTILIGTGEQKELVEVLDTIAKQNKGTAKIVSKDDF